MTFYRSSVTKERPDHTVELDERVKKNKNKSGPMKVVYHIVRIRSKMKQGPRTFFIIS